MPKRVTQPGLPKITRLPSGSYHAIVYSHTDDAGKRHYQSFTNKSKTDLALEIMQFKADKEKTPYAEAVTRTTVGEAIDLYIDSKSAILSPSSVREYRNKRNRVFQRLMPLQLDDLTPHILQAAVNVEAVTHSPKTVRDSYGLIRSSVNAFRPDINMDVALPQKEKHEIQIPTEEEVSAMIRTAEGTTMYIPVMLAACCGLRRSEISALEWQDVDFKTETLYIHRALVYNENNELTEKGTKTTSSTRRIRLFPLVLDALKSERAARPDAKDTDHITITPTAITHAFPKLLQSAGCRHYRFHDLRHYTVSVMLALNVPKNYIADYVGHETEAMIDEVYGHIMQTKKSDIENTIQSYFSDLLTPDCKS